MPLHVYSPQQLGRSLRGALFLLSAFVAGGCAIDAEVSSNTRWSGSFDGDDHVGQGSQVVSMGRGLSSRCATVQKLTEEGFVTVSVNGENRQTTTVPFGSVTSCGGGS